MKALVVLGQPPSAQGGAAGRCALAMIRGLRGHDVDVRVVAAQRAFSAGWTPPADLDVEVVTMPATAATLRARLAPIRRPLGELGRPPFADRVAALAADADVVHLETSETVWAAAGVSTPTAVHLHYRERMDRDLGLPWRRQFRQVLEFDRAERRALRTHRHLLASSPVVAASMRRQAPHAEVVLAPLCLDPADYDCAPLTGPPVAGIIGTAAWPPTRRAFDRLIGSVWPKVTTTAPEARLLVAGRGTEALAPMGTTTVEIVGEVDSSQAFFRRLSVLVYPLSRGSGMKVKVLEAMASGVPVVTTAQGAEGIDGGAGVVVADDDDSIALATARLLRDGQERLERGAAARAAFEERYRPEVATAPIVELYTMMSSR